MNRQAACTCIETGVGTIEARLQALITKIENAKPYETLHEGRAEWVAELKEIREELIADETLRILGSDQ